MQIICLKVIVNVLVVILITAITIQNIFTTFLLKFRSSFSNILFLSLSFSDLLLSSSLLLIISTESSPYSDAILYLSLVLSLSSSAVLAIDKLLSLACPFSYPCIVTFSTAVKTTILIWTFSFTFPTLFLLSNISIHHWKLFTIIILTSFLLIACICHVYVIAVAQKQRNLIRRTSKSYQRSVNRLNSIQTYSNSQTNKPQIPKNKKMKPTDDQEFTDTFSHDFLENVFIYPKTNPSQTYSTETPIQPPVKTYFPFIMSLLFLIFGWVPFLTFHLQFYLTDEDLNKLDLMVEMLVMIPLLILSVARPHLEGKCKLRSFLRKYQERKILEEKNIHDLINLAAVPIRILPEDNVTKKNRQSLGKQDKNDEHTGICSNWSSRLRKKNVSFKRGVKESIYYESSNFGLVSLIINEKKLFICLCTYLKETKGWIFMKFIRS